MFLTCHIMFTSHVFDLTVTSVDGEDVGGAIARRHEGSPASDISLRLCFKMCRCDTT